jgi:UDP-glucose 4-epimerase
MIMHGEYAGKRVLVTGGLGFIGSNLVLRLVELGARITIVDSLVEGCGGKIDNIGPVQDEVQIRVADLREADAWAPRLERPDVIFNLAGETSHSRSLEAPVRDLELNAIAQLSFLQLCAARFPAVRIVYTGTRQVYGAPCFLPVTEDHPVEPVDFNGVHKFAADTYHLLFSRLGALDARVLRLTNVYGPRMGLFLPGQGVLSVYLRQALTGQPISVFGDGKQLRDPVHVDDVVEALLRAGLSSGRRRVLNLAGPEVLEMQQIAEIAAAAGGCQIVRQQFAPRQKAIDIGSFWADTSCAQRELHWKAQIRFAEGFAHALQFYKTGGEAAGSAGCRRCLTERLQSFRKRPC